LSIKEAYGDKTGIALAYNNLGYLYGHMEDYKTALIYLNKSYSLYSDVDSKKGLVMVEYNLGLIYNELDNADSSIKYLQKSLKLVNDYGFNDYKMPVYEELIKFYSINKPEKVLFNKYFDEYISYKDSVFNKLKLSKLKEVEYDNDANQIVQEANNLLQENKQKDQLIYQLKMWFMVLGGVLIFIFLIYLFFFKNKT